MLMTLNIFNLQKQKQILRSFEHIKKFATIIKNSHQQLYLKGFKIISWEPNFRLSQDPGGYFVFEIVFRKAEICVNTNT